MPSYPSGSGADGGGSSFGGPATVAALFGASAGLGALEEKKRRKRAAELRRYMTDAIDAGASNQVGAIQQGAKVAGGAAAQNSLDRGFHNSSVATDAQSGVIMDASQRMGDVQAEAGRAKARAAYDTFDTGGGQDLSGVGEALGYMLATQQTGPSSGGTAGNEQAGSSAMLQEGGAPEQSSAMFKNGPAGSLEVATLDPQDARMRSLLNRSRKMRGSAARGIA